jgi:hypothetical protein
VLVVPVPELTFTEPLRWQADSGVPSSMFGGYFMGPARNGQAATDGAGLPAAGEYLNRLWELSAGNRADVAAARRARPPHVTIAQMRAQLAAWHPAAVVAVATENSALGRYLIGLLGRPTISAGGVIAWHLSTGPAA